MTLSTAQPQRRSRPTKVILLLGLALFLVATAQAQAPAEAPRHTGQHEGDTSSALADTPLDTAPLTPMILVPIVNGVALVQDSHEFEDSDTVRTTGPWVELDHQDELDALRNEHINDPQNYSYMTKPKAQQDKIDEVAKREPSPVDKILISEDVAISKPESEVAQKHCSAWLDFGGMESDLGVL
ncbi:hypothetical protein BG000_007511, partial [Podila horticola]